MKKVSMVVMEKEKEEALTKLRNMGVVHLEKKSVASPALTALVNRRTQMDGAIGMLTAFTPKKKGVTLTVPPFSGDLAGHVAALSERWKKLQDHIFNYQREKGDFEKWGDFNPNDFKFLAENGINMYLYDISVESYINNAAKTPVIVLSMDKKNNSVCLLAFDVIPEEVPFPLPEEPLSAVNERNRQIKNEIKKIEEELISLSPLIKRLEGEKKSLLEDIEFETARGGMEVIKDNGEEQETGNLAVSFISGYTPVSDVGMLKRAASENGWALCADDPAPDDMEVPTKLANSKLTSLIYPLTNFLEMTPGYRETDISGWFLLFFTLFFGMIFGDAAYGSILLLISFIGIAKTAKKGVPLILKFMFLLSVSNLVWGALTCAWFGIDPALLPPVLQNISLPLIVNLSSAPEWLASYNAGNFWIQYGLLAPAASIEAMALSNQNNLMLFCFTIALVQLGVAHLKGIAGNITSLKVLAELGQLGMLFGMYFVVLSLVVFNTGFEGVELWQYGCLAAGFVLVFIFGNYEGSVLKSIVTSCANILTNILGITNVFSDIMSYIRLWAVGLAGASIASTVDSFAGPMIGHFAFFVFGLLLFAFGHGFNMVLNLLSVIVHGVRLNTLEFSSHVGISWSGFAYKPFAKRNV
jgi:V/A-type H+-transporting ATPase subunit I